MNTKLTVVVLLSTLVVGACASQNYNTQKGAAIGAIGGALAGQAIGGNTAGTLHGGVMGALVDMSVATALRSVMPLSSRMTTVEYKVNFLKPVSEGTVTACATLLRRGATIAVGSTEIRNGDGEVVAFGSATYYILKAPVKRNVPAIMD